MLSPNNSIFGEYPNVIYPSELEKGTLLILQVLFHIWTCVSIVTSKEGYIWSYIVQDKRFDLSFAIIYYHFLCSNKPASARMYLFHNW